MPDAEKRKTVLLRHECGADSHFDWMFENPAQTPGEAGLITFRTQIPVWQWTTHRTIDLQRIDDHRRAYLTYEGPLTGDRGTVKRVDEGEVIIREWSDESARMKLHMKRTQCTVHIRRIRLVEWQLVITGATASGA